MHEQKYVNFYCSLFSSDGFLSFTVSKLLKNMILMLYSHVL